MKHPILEVKHLSASYQDKMVLSDCDFTICEGELIGIVGSSGIGKSTFLEAILGNLRQRMKLSQETEMLLEGKEWQQLTLEERRPIYREKIGVIFQNVQASFDAMFTIGDQLREVMLEDSSDAVEGLLREVHLETSVLQRYPHELSGGMLQRVAFMMAICNRPRLIVADEPYSALDVVLQEEMMALLQSYVQRHQASAIVVMHQQALAQAYMTQVLTLSQGRFVHQSRAGQRLNQEMSYSASVVPLMVVDHVGKVFPPEKQALHQASFTLYEGDFLGIIGESGAGKTTLGKILPGLTSYDEGHILFRGEALSEYLNHNGQSYYKEVQYIFQNSLLAFNPRQTMMRSLEEPLRFLRQMSAKKERHRTVRELFQQLHLDEAWLEKYPQQLSGGQCQRCAIARALLARPKLLICDEITSALDEENQQLILQLLKQYQQDHGLSVMMISHQVDLIRDYATHVVVLKEGRIIDDFVPQSVVLEECHPYTKALWEHIPFD